jgi:SAM-dependent methyltransferase
MEEIKRQPSIPSNRYDADYFLTACEGHEEFVETEGRELSRRLSQAFAVAEIQPGMRILDIGSGRGEIVRHCARLGADAFGMDYAAVANSLARRLMMDEKEANGAMEIIQGDAKWLPFDNHRFDRVLMFDIVEHLHPWELHQALLEVRRTLRKDGRLVIHTAPNRWYDLYAYPLVRLYRRLTGEGQNYPRNPREIVPANVHVHVNEQDILRLPRALRQAGFQAKVWLDSPPQNRREGIVLSALRVMAFDLPPFRWFFEREIFAVAEISSRSAPRIMR